MAETVLLAGGGTGGHVFPMIAVADELRRLLPTLRLVFVGTERGLESKVVPECGYELRYVSMAPLLGGGVWGGLKGAVRAGLAMPEGLLLVRELQPAVVFSMGGYAAGSAALAARLLRVPLALMEPNSVLGLANRLVAPLVQRAYTSYEDVESSFPRGTVLRSGLAIRRGFARVPFQPDGDVLRVLVLGGSQGARTLNEAVPRALSQTRVRVRVVHQAGKGKDEAVRTLYQALGATEAVSVLPFIADMPSALAQADLVISRSGAGACSEICAVGRPSLLVPYPFAAGDHQRKNAEALVRAGAARQIADREATPDRLTALIDSLGQGRSELATMAESAARIGRPSAAERVARDLLELGGLGVPEEASASPELSPRASEVH